MSFTFPSEVGYCHADNGIYLAGGCLKEKYYWEFRKIMENGKLRNLEMMPAPKVGFPLVIWKKSNVLFSIGGFKKWKIIEVEEYSILKNKWRRHSQLPQALSYSSAVILHSTLYIFGGSDWSKDVLQCDLSSRNDFKWNALNLDGVRF